MLRSRLRFAAVAAALGAVSAASAASSSSSCDFGGLVTLAKGRNDSQAVVYDADCDQTKLSVDDDGKLSATSLAIAQIESLPDVESLYVGAAVVPVEGQDRLTRRFVTARAGFST
jgi:hypothetical protein